MGCVALALVAALPARGATQFRFDELASWEALNQQYLADGVVFGPESETWNVVTPDAAEWPVPSPPNVAAVLFDASGEIQFPTPVAGVSARFMTSGSQVRVTAFSPAGVVLDVRVLSSPPFATVLYTFAASNTRIGKVLVEGTPTLWGMDDLAVDRGAPPVTGAHVDGTSGANGWYRSSVTVTLRAGDPNGDAVTAVHYAIDGGADVVTPGPDAAFTLPTEGEHQVSYYAVDSTGMVEAATLLPLKLDSVAPVVNVASPVATDYVQGDPIAVTVAASDALSGVATTNLDIDGTAVSSGQTLTSLAAGPHLLTAEARDLAGNSTTRTVAFQVVVPDPGVPPVTTSTLDGTVGENGWYRSAVTVRLSATDPDGDAIAGIHYSLDGGAEITTAAATVSFPLATDGEHVVRYHAVDARGTVEAETVQTVRVDGAAPAVTVASPTASSYPADATVTVAAAASDVVSGVSETHLDIDGVAVTTGQAVTGLAAGTHLFTATARDTAGNVAARQVSFTVAAPTPAPEPTPTPNPTSAPFSVSGGGTGRVNGRPVVVSLWARRNAAGQTTGQLVYKELTGGLRVHCEPINSVERTSTGLRIGGTGVKRQTARSETRCTVGFEVRFLAGRRDAFTLQVDGVVLRAGRLTHGHFVAR